MELGLGFDDEDFVSNNKIKQPITSYNAKFCYPKWFNENAEIEKAIDKAQIYKFGADKFYYDGEYSQAILKYQLCLEHLPYEFTPVWRDVVESIARCYLQLKQFDESEKLARRLLERSEYIIFKRQSLTLLYDIQMARNDIEDSIETLQMLIELDCCYAPYWYNLYKLYTRQQELSSPEQARSQYSYHAKAATCLVRVRFLRRALHNQACDVVKEKNARILNDIEKDLEKLNITTDIINTIRSWMLSIKQDENEDTDNSCVPLLSCKELEDKWFGWSQVMKRLNKTCKQVIIRNEVLKFQ